MGEKRILRFARGQTFYVIAALFVLLLILGAFGVGWGSFWAVERLSIPLPFLDTAGSGGTALAPATAAGAGATEQEMALFWEAMKLLDENYYSQEELPQGTDLTYAAIEGVVRATDDPHTGFMDPERTEIVESSLEGEFEGIGATVEMSEEGLVIVSPFPDTPAENAGLRPGDLVVEVDGEPTIGMTIEEAVARVRGPEGTAVHLTVRRAGVDELLEFEVTRGTIVIPIVESRLLTPQGTGAPFGPIGYIRLNDFGGRSVQQFTEGVRALLDQGAERLIVDLRSNPGGYLQAAVDI
ncbi:MAG: S41 family peptidase, partial [Ardenticatenaceae bacterium]